MDNVKTILVALVVLIGAGFTKTAKAEGFMGPVPTARINIGVNVTPAPRPIPVPVPVPMPVIVQPRPPIMGGCGFSPCMPVGGSHGFVGGGFGFGFGGGGFGVGGGGFGYGFGFGMPPRRGFGRGCRMFRGHRRCGGRRRFRSFSLGIRVGGFGLGIRSVSF